MEKEKSMDPKVPSIAGQSTLFEGVIMVRGKSVGFVPVPGLDEDIVISTESLSFAIDGDIV